MPSPVHARRIRWTLSTALLFGAASFAHSEPTEARPRVHRAHDRSHNDDAAADASAVPRRRDPPVVDAPSLRSARKADVIEGLIGWTMAALDAPFKDRRRRVPQTERPEPFGHTLQIGERFKFDVKFAGNPAGLAEAAIISVEPDPRGRPPAGSPMIKLTGHARTSGIVSLLSTVTDDVVTMVDAHTGAAISSQNILHYAGWSPVKYKHRVTDAQYHGRGHVRLVDTKDGKAKTKVKQVPVDTFDPMSAMAWVRSLDLSKGNRAKAHAIDGTTLLRIEVESNGRRRPRELPSITRALGLGPEDVIELRGVLTRVDEFDQAIPGKRVYEMRAYLSADERRIPLVLESDMWVGSLRLELTSYDPPSAAPTQASAPSEPDGSSARASSVAGSE